MEFDAEETDDEGEVFDGEDFYDEDNNEVRTDLDASDDYQEYIGEVVKYEVDDDKVVIEKIDDDEIETYDEIELDV